MTAVSDPLISRTLVAVCMIVALGLGVLLVVVLTKIVKRKGRTK